MPRYTQGVMDLGATVCLPRKPACAACPVSDVCVARREGEPERYPVKTRKLKRSAQSLWLLWAHARDGAVWLRQAAGHRASGPACTACRSSTAATRCVTRCLQRYRAAPAG